MPTLLPSPLPSNRLDQGGQFVEFFSAEPRLRHVDEGRHSYWRRSPEEGPERYAVASPVALLPLGARQLIVHGDADLRVPIDLSHAYAAAAAAAGDDVTFHSHEGSDHFVVIDPGSPEWSGVADWLGVS